MTDTKLTPKREAINLHRYGTKSWEILPGNVVQAAEADMKSKHYNAALFAKRRDKKTYPLGSPDRKMLGEARRYAFVPKHVRKAKTALELIELAIKETSEGLKSDDVNRLRIYGADLFAAHYLLKEKGRD